MLGEREDKGREENKFVEKDDLARDQFVAEEAEDRVQFEQQQEVKEQHAAELAEQKLEDRQVADQKIAGYQNEGPAEVVETMDELESEKVVGIDADHQPIYEHDVEVEILTAEEVADNAWEAPEYVPFTNEEAAQLLLHGSQLPSDAIDYLERDSGQWELPRGSDHAIFAKDPSEPGNLHSIDLEGNILQSFDRAEILAAVEKIRDSEITSEWREGTTEVTPQADVNREIELMPHAPSETQQVHSQDRNVELEQHQEIWGQSKELASEAVVEMNQVASQPMTESQKETAALLRGDMSDVQQAQDIAAAPQEASEAKQEPATKEEPVMSPQQNDKPAHEANGEEISEGNTEAAPGVSAEQLPEINGVPAQEIDTKPETQGEAKKDVEVDPALQMFRELKADIEAKEKAFAPAVEKEASNEAGQQTAISEPQEQAASSKGSGDAALDHFRSTCAQQDQKEASQAQQPQQDEELRRGPGMAA